MEQLREINVLMPCGVTPVRAMQFNIGRDTILHDNHQPGAARDDPIPICTGKAALNWKQYLYAIRRERNKGSSWHGVVAVIGECQRHPYRTHPSWCRVRELGLRHSHRRWDIASR